MISGGPQLSSQGPRRAKERQPGPTGKAVTRLEKGMGSSWA